MQTDAFLRPQILAYYRLRSTYERVDCLETSLHRLVHGFSWNNSWCFHLNSGTGVGGDGALTIDSVTERVNDSSEEAVADGHIDDGSSSLDDITFLDLSTHVTNLD